MKKSLIIGLTAFTVLLTATTVVFSQPASPSAETAPDEQASVFNFPIEDLGNCENEEACANYCEDPVNYNSCADFAKKNGFYQDDQTQYAADEFWQDAQNELGCNSAETCATFCAEPANYEACSAFAKRNEIPGGYVEEIDPGSVIFEDSQTVLGCNSPESCLAFCNDPVNAQACTDFANQKGMLGGTVSQGPGGCQTPETCSSYCSDPANFNECSTFGSGGGTFSGPGGCDSPESCRAYCETNYKECRSYSPGTSGAYVPITCANGEVHGVAGICEKPLEPVDGSCPEGTTRGGGR